MLGHSILKIAREKALVQYKLFNIREYAENRRCVDDRPYGGGPGMVMKPEPIFNTVEAIERETDARCKKILLTPQGSRFFSIHCQRPGKRISFDADMRSL